MEYKTSRLGSTYVTVFKCINIALNGTTIVTSDCTIVTSCHHGSIRTTFISNNSITQKTCNRKYA